MSMRTPLSRVRGLGSAKDGTEHFWRQRVTGAALTILVIGFLILLIAVAGRPYEETIAVLGNPFVALLMVLMVATGAYHMKLGMQIVIEDYVEGGARIAALIASSFFAFAVGLASVLALLKISFGG